MSDFDPTEFEPELRTLRPARPGEEQFRKIQSQLARLRGSRELPVAPNASRLNLLRWWLPIPIAAAFSLIFLAIRPSAPSEKPGAAHLLSTAFTPLKADHVEIDRQLVTNFDAIAQLPNGEPVRFRCEQWLDRVRVRDSKAGLVLERTAPRLEVVPVRFETY